VADRGDGHVAHGRILELGGKRLERLVRSDKLARNGNRIYRVGLNQELRRIVIDTRSVRLGACSSLRSGTAQVIDLA
jgi:hypothetical protein